MFKLVSEAMGLLDPYIRFGGDGGRTVDDRDGYKKVRGNNHSRKGPCLDPYIEFGSDGGRAVGVGTSVKGDGKQPQ